MKDIEYLLKIYKENEALRELIKANLKNYFDIIEDQFEKMNDKEKLELLNETSASNMLQEPPLMFTLLINIYTSKSDVMNLVSDKIIEIVEKYSSSIGGGSYKSSGGYFCFSYTAEVNMRFDYLKLFNEIDNFLQELRFRYKMDVENISAEFNPIIAFRDKGLTENKDYEKWVKAFKDHEELKSKDIEKIAKELCIPANNIELMLKNTRGKITI